MYILLYLGPIHSIKPGKITYYQDGVAKDDDNLHIQSGENYTENTFKSRTEGSTDPHLGMNMYAENRVSLCSRPKPLSDEKVEESKQVKIPKTVEKVEDSKIDGTGSVNSLAGLII